MSLVSAEDFNLVPYNIPNLETLADSFAEYVDVKEEEVLIKLLGRLLATKFLEAVADATEADPLAERWVNLRDGVVYTHNGIRYKWEGMVAALKPYIYALWTQENIDHDSGMGLVVAEAENGKPSSPALRLSRAFNNFVIRVGNPNSCKDTLYGYLFNSEETFVADIAEYDYTSIQTYLNDYFTTFKKANQFGL